MTTKAQPERRLYIETYGCQMNVADSEVVASIMGMAGYELADSVDDADAILLNTCSIRDNAEQKVANRLRQLLLGQVELHSPPLDVVCDVHGVRMTGCFPSVNTR